MFILLVIVSSFLFSATGKYLIVDTFDAQDGGGVNSQGIVKISQGLIKYSFLIIKIMLPKSLHVGSGIGTVWRGVEVSMNQNSVADGDT